MPLSPVSFSSARSCFVTLPQSIDESLVSKQRAAGGALVIKLSWADARGDRQAFVGWTGALQKSSDAVEVPVMLARFIGLMGEDQLVRVDPVEFVPAAQRVDVEPVSADDWEILSMHAEYLEVVFLQQTPLEKHHFHPQHHHNHYPQHHRHHHQHRYQSPSC